MQVCECNSPGHPVDWNISLGWKTLCRGRGYSYVPVKERCRYSERDDETADFDSYVERIHQNLPVILTFCYDLEARRGLGQAYRRVASCSSMVGIGHLVCDGQKFLICHDGLASGQASPALADRVSPSDLGLSTDGTPWGQSGTSLYRWNGSYTNLVMVFIGHPKRQN